MMLLTQDIRTKLETNGCEQQELISKGFAVADPMPVVKLFTPDASAVWLLTTLDPNDKDLAYGLCDLGFGSPELGHVRITMTKDCELRRFRHESRRLAAALINGLLNRIPVSGIGEPNKMKHIL